MCLLTAEKGETELSYTLKLLESEGTSLYFRCNGSSYNCLKQQ